MPGHRPLPPRPHYLVFHAPCLEVWQMRSPSLQTVTQNDVLLLDEGQDMIPAMLSIFMNKCDQQIYIFLKLEVGFLNIR